MNTQNNYFSRFNIAGILLGLCLAVGLIISASQVTRVWLHIADSQVITVTGAARQYVTSDLAVWSSSFAAEADSLASAQQKLKADEVRVAAFLKQNGITNGEISAINIQRLKLASKETFGDDDQKKTVGFRLRQTLRVESGNIQQVVELQQKSGSLVEQGVELDDLGIQFIYTKTAEAKIEMLAAATKDARQRAEQIAANGGRKISGLRNARMGVFQITQRNSNETSAEGINDTTSKDKSIRSVISASFSME